MLMLLLMAAGKAQDWHQKMPETHDFAGSFMGHNKNTIAQRSPLFKKSPIVGVIKKDSRSIERKGIKSPLSVVNSNYKHHLTDCKMR